MLRTVNSLTGFVTPHLGQRFVFVAVAGSVARLKVSLFERMRIHPAWAFGCLGVTSA
jgi:D-alanyl-D-alanine carboxypeptidase